MAAPFDLQRFVAAQDACYDTVLAELRRGRKESHWMWFVFPQIAGLGRSATAQYYAIGSLDEARAYLSHPRLGPRLRECVAAAMAVPDRTAEEVFGSIDAVKLCSSLTLFASAAPDEPLFHAALDKYFSGSKDPLTLELLGGR